LFTAKRKTAFEQLQPGAAHGSPDVSRQVGDTRERAEVVRFTADTAAKTGLSERSVQRNAERGAKVCNSALAMVTRSRHFGEAGRRASIIRVCLRDAGRPPPLEAGAR
jgi:hypothetical protein